MLHTRHFRPTALLILLLGLTLLLGQTVAAQQSGRIFLPLAAGAPTDFSATPFGGVFNQVTAITHAGDDRVFVAEREGRIKTIHPDGRVTVFFDLRHRVLTDRGEYGFYDVAFHPGYADPASPGFGFFYVSYTTGHDDGQSRDVDLIISRFRVSANPDAADGGSEVILLTEPQSTQVHKGGSLDFDPRDNHLYAGLGDDQRSINAQDGASLKGKIIRLAVDEAPRDAAGGQRATVTTEVWASGLRNPWRMDVDATGNQIIIGDVGDSHWEEVNLAPLSSSGTNFGWPCLEGPFVRPDFSGEAVCQNPERFQAAIHEYTHRDEFHRCVVIGGNVYRPSGNPGDGRYIFADLCTREIFALQHAAGGAWQRGLLGVLPTADQVITLGEDRYGTLYVGTLTERGPIYKLYIP